MFCFLRFPISLQEAPILGQSSAVVGQHACKISKYTNRLCSHLVLDQSGSEAFGLLSLFPTAGTICVSDVEAIKVCCNTPSFSRGTDLPRDCYQQMTSGRSSFRKNIDDYGVLKEFGNNILVVEGEEWRRQRRICAPAFSDVRAPSAAGQ